MVSALQQQWINRGRPATLAYPLAAMRDELRAAGYVVYDIGNQQHLDATPPEDHTPYSATGWPDPSPFGWLFAIDIMPPAPSKGLPSLQVIGRRIFDARQSGRAPFVKYMNWGPVSNTAAVQDRWTPGYARRSSSDTGHIHLSGRTDYATSAVTYNPLTDTSGGDEAVKIILAVGPDGTIYRCDFKSSMPAGDVRPEHLPHMRYLARQMGAELMHGPGDDAEWTWGGWLRKGWTPEVFGPVVTGAAAPAPAPAASLDQEQVDAAVLQSLTAVTFETRAVLPG